MFELPNSKLRGKERKEALIDFATEIIKISDKIGFRVSARGWCYQLEQARLINKDEFDKVENLINSCRREGILPIDFTAEEEGRKFSGVVMPDDDTILAHIGWALRRALNCGDSYVPEYWEDEEYYIQMVVEKVDLKTLFLPVCKKYRIPIATSKGWGSMLMRAEYAKRFNEAEINGLQCVLLYCGDFDPDGGRISDFLRTNLADLSNVEWEDGDGGYWPGYDGDEGALIIDRFGLNFDFIEKNKLTWIDNLITGSKRNLADPNHKNYNMDYVQTYLREVGERKCEANALVVRPEEGRELCQEAIEKYLGKGAEERFALKKQQVYDEINRIQKDHDIVADITEIINRIKEAEEND